MKFLSNKIFRTVLLTLMLVWATTFFWLLCPVLSVNIIVIIVSSLCLISIITNSNNPFTIIYLSFVTSYVLYGYMLVNNFPVWLIMLGVLIITLYLLTYLEQQENIVEDQRIVFLTIFSLIILELFLFLGYFLISPINRSLLISLTIYLIYGFCEKVITSGKYQEMKSYLLVFLFVFVTIILTASWGKF